MSSTSSRVGKAFERDFSNSCPDGAMLVRLKDGKGYGKNPADYILLAPNYGCLIELKTTKEKRLPKSNIREHQLAILAEASRQNIGAYFVVNFRTYEETYVVAGDVLADALQNVKSLPIQWFRDNAIKIPQTKKRTRYIYDYEFMVRGVMSC